MNKVQNIGIKAVEYWNTTVIYQYIVKYLLFAR